MGVPVLKMTASEGRAGTHNDRLSEAVIMSAGTPIPAQRTCRRRSRDAYNRPFPSHCAMAWGTVSRCHGLVPMAALRQTARSFVNVSVLADREHRGPVADPKVVKDNM